MGIFARWKEYRRQRAFTVALLSILEEHAESGRPWGELIRLRVDDPVEWVQSEQTWAVPISLRELEVGQVVILSSGRGGKEEDICRVTGVLYELPDFSGVMYSVSFDAVS